MTADRRRIPMTKLPPSFAGFADVPADSPDPGRQWWDANADEYLAEHGDFLGAADFCWCPEGLREADAGLLGPVAGRRVLEVGCGAAQCSRWLTAAGAMVVATDISAGMLTEGRRIDRELGTEVATVQADARRLPFADAAFDVAFTAFGALPFVPDARRVHAEVARVLVPGGTWVFSVTHPVRWAFPDDPSERGLRVTRSYFDRRPSSVRSGTPSTTARSATMWTSWSRPGSGCSAWSSPSGQPATAGSGAAGARCGVP